MYEYIVAIDGGGTKTAGSLYTLAGQLIKTAETGFSNFAINEKAAISHVHLLIDDLLKNVQYNKVFIQMGIAGTSKLSNKDAFLKEIEHKYNATADLVTDAVICVYAIEKAEEEPLIMAIGGTGSVVLTYKDDTIYKMGGWGHLLGDEGSAYHVVMTAIKHIISEYEQNIPYSNLSMHLLNVMGVNDIYDVIEYVYNRDKSTLAQLSLEVQHVAKTDPFAVELLINEGLLLAKQIINAYNRFTKDEYVVISLRGSFSLQGLYVKETVINELKKHIPKFRLDIDGNQPVYGAYVLAKINIEKGA